MISRKSLHCIRVDLVSWCSLSLFRPERISILMIIFCRSGDFRSVYQWSQVWLVCWSGYVWSSCRHCPSQVPYESGTEQHHKSSIRWTSFRLQKGATVSSFCFAIKNVDDIAEQRKKPPTKQIACRRLLRVGLCRYRQQPGNWGLLNGMWVAQTDDLRLLFRRRFLDYIQLFWMLYNVTEFCLPQRRLSQIETFETACIEWSLPWNFA